MSCFMIPAHMKTKLSSEVHPISVPWANAGRVLSEGDTMGFFLLCTQRENGECGCNLCSIDLKQAASSVGHK